MHLQAWKKTGFFGEIFTAGAPSPSSPFHSHVLAPPPPPPPPPSPPPPPLPPFEPYRHLGRILTPGFARSFWQFEL